ncbi:MAG TPA: VCBS repeat-containing protein, partial [Pyrinomonadaceae bacterium]|nr:VCBS repeat-containing protein [Pyrinomonadaceae bacterium]
PSGTFSAKIELTENYNSVLAVYSSNSATPTFAQLIPVAQSFDYHGFTDSRYRVKFFAEAGKHYFIAVAGNNSNNATPEGNFQLKWGVNRLRYSADYERYDDNSAISVFRPSDGGWYSVYSFTSGLTSSLQWGKSGDTPVAADYDGNGSTDIAVARNENGVKNWYIRNAVGISGLTWGLATDKAITGDYDGDGRADVGVMRLTANGYAWYIRQSSNGAMRSFLFGTTGDNPVFGDFDGDGMTEVAVVRNTPNGMVWYMLKSSTNYTQFSAQQFGTTPDVPTAEDYDGDGRTDIAIFRPSTGYWYILQSSNGALDYKVFGGNGDKPQPADYDGDGKADVGVFRPSNGTWYILRSGNGQPIIRQWGAATDIPVSSMTTLSQ